MVGRISIYSSRWCNRPGSVGERKMKVTRPLVVCCCLTFASSGAKKMATHLWVSLEIAMIIWGCRIRPNRYYKRKMQFRSRSRGQGSGSIFRRQADLFRFADEHRKFVPDPLEPEETSISANGSQFLTRLESQRITMCECDRTTRSFEIRRMQRT